MDIETGTQKKKERQAPICERDLFNSWKKASFEENKNEKSHFTETKVRKVAGGEGVDE